MVPGKKGRKAADLQCDPICCGCLGLPRLIMFTQKMICSPPDAPRAHPEAERLPAMGARSFLAGIR